MGRKQQLDNFFENNITTLDNSRNRLFADLYATGNFELKLGNNGLISSDVPTRVLEQILVMERKDEVIKRDPSLSKYVCILPLIDINKESQQLTSAEMRNLYLSSNKNKSITILPHAINNYLSGEFWEAETFCIMKDFQNQLKKSNHPLVYTTGHMKVLKQIYGYSNMPFLNQGVRGGTFIEELNLINGRNSMFSDLYFEKKYLKRGEKERKKSEKNSITIRGLSESNIEKLTMEDEENLQNFRMLREIRNKRKLKVLDMLTNKKKVDFKGRIGVSEIYTEVFFDNCIAFMNKQKRDFYRKLKYDAADYLSNKNSSIQYSLL